MERRGTLRDWNDSKGFGFIRPEGGGEDLFVHISAVRGQQRPKTGAAVCYVPGRDTSGRACATHMRDAGALALDDPRIRQRPRARGERAQFEDSQRRLLGGRIQRWPLKLVIWAALLAAPLTGAVQMQVGQGSAWALIAYGLASLLAIGLYAEDKHCAIRGGQRTAEKHLHLCELLGGWPGALIAQQLFRHKTRKASYQATFWLIVALHQAFWIDYLLFDQAGLRYLTGLLTG